MKHYLRRVGVRAEVFRAVHVVDKLPEINDLKTFKETLSGKGYTIEPLGKKDYYPIFSKFKALELAFSPWTGKISTSKSLENNDKKGLSMRYGVRMLYVYKK